MMSTNYVILVDIDEQTYVDGHYKDEQMAIDVFEHWAETYPNLEFELAQLVGGFPIPDALFMAKNIEVLKFANSSAKITNSKSYNRTLH
tara:strand:+ start:456 stop:722 length:267 start_codon:yes stop_codon:yes gene_type:complete